MKLKKDLYWLERRLPVVAEVIMLCVLNPGLKLWHDGRKVWVKGEMLCDHGIEMYERSYTEQRGNFMWAASVGWLDRVQCGWDLSAEGLAAINEGYPDMPMLIEVRSAMYEAAKVGVLPTGVDDIL